MRKLGAYPVYLVLSGAILFTPALALFARSLRHEQPVEPLSEAI